MNNAFRPDRLPSYDDDSIIREIKRVVLKYFKDESPRQKDFNRHSMVHSATIVKRFGSWAKAIEKAGFEYESTRTINPSKLIQDLNKVKGINNGLYFTQDFYKKNGGKYSFTTLKKGLGSPDWESLLEKILNLSKAPRPIRIIISKSKNKRISLFTEEQLFSELKRVWDVLRRRPLYMEFRKLGNIGTKVYERRFGSWRKAIEIFSLKFGYNLQGTPGATATAEILLSELKKVVSEIPSPVVSFKKYKELGGTYSIGTFKNYFGSWKNAVEKTGKRPGHGHTVKYSNEELFSELQRIWEKLGRQPMFKEMKQHGNISGAIYQARFGSWIKAIHVFCSDRENPNKEDDINKNISNSPTEVQENKLPNSQESILKTKEETDYIIMTTSRVPSKRLRFLVLKRDNFTCVTCGRSRAKYPELELEVDHVKPYSKGGETILDNLQSLCKDCNQGKSDLTD